MIAQLPSRRGIRPTTTDHAPHSQLDQQPPDPAVAALLAERVLALPGVRCGPSGISVPGARALLLETSVPARAAAFLVGREFAHLHPGPDHSLHLVLPPELAEQVVGAGWGELHLLAGSDGVPPGAVMVYAPRDRAEVDVVAAIVRAAPTTRGSRRHADSGARRSVAGRDRGGATRFRDSVMRQRHWEL